VGIFLPLTKFKNYEIRRVARELWDECSGFWIDQNGVCLTIFSLFQSLKSVWTFYQIETINASKWIFIFINIHIYSFTIYYVINLILIYFIQYLKIRGITLAAKIGGRSWSRLLWWARERNERKGEKNNKKVDMRTVSAGKMGLRVDPFTTLEDPRLV